jgi:hypothetical protein
MEDLTLNPAEVDSAIIVPVRKLSDPAVCKYTQFGPRGLHQAGYTLPLYDIEPQKIWGLTAIVTYQILKAFLPRYKHKMYFQSPIRFQKS